MSTWYLNAVAPNWSAIVWDDYQSAFPLTTIKKGGIEQFIQPIFTREFTIMGAPQPSHNLLQFLQKEYRYVDIRLNHSIENYHPICRKHQQIILKSDFTANYSNNAKRLIKKAHQIYTYQPLDDIKPFLTLIEDTLVPKIDEFTPSNIQKLHKLMVAAIVEKKGSAYGVFTSDGDLVGAGFVFKHQNKVTYLKGAATSKAKKNGAMYGLIDHLLAKFQPDFEIFDFGGSDIENIAKFYQKFGATNRNYYHYQMNNLPQWYKIIKKILAKK